MSSDGKVLQNASGPTNIAADIHKHARVTIGSDVGDLIGALNDGAVIQVEGSAGKYAADGMTDGEVIINGDADDGAGTSMRGGMLVIRGNAKNRVGQLLKGGTVIVGGSVKHHVGSFMMAGTVIIGGDAGRELGSSMVGGTIFIRGTHEALCAKLRKAEPVQEEIEFLEKLLSKYQLDLDCRKFAKICTRPRKMA